MAHPKTRETDSQSFKNEAVKLGMEDADQTQQKIAEAAYYIGLNRGRHAHPGNELTDWFEAEKAVRDNLD